MNNVSFKHADEASEAQIRAFEKAGFGLGTLSVTIHEESDARETRDAAISAARSTLQVAEQAFAMERKLRKQVEELSASFYKERQEHTQTKFDAIKEAHERNMKIARLERENEILLKSWRNSIAGQWVPPKKGGVLKGILVDKSPSGSLVFELTEFANGCEKDGRKLRRVPPGRMIEVNEWMQLKGLWPEKAGYLIYITRPDDRNFPLVQRIKVQVSDKPLQGK